MEDDRTVPSHADKGQAGDGKVHFESLETIVMATHTGMTTEAFQKIVNEWMATAEHPRFNKPFQEMVYQPMLEVMRYLRANGYRTYIVTGGSQDFVRAYAQPVYAKMLLRV